MKTAPAASSAPRRFRWLRISVFVLAGLYVLGVAGGYVFLHSVRKIEAVGWGDVALFRLGNIRRSLASQHFRQGKAAWDAKDYQQAYVYYASAVARDPENRAGRLEAARFLAAIGATQLELTMLEDGLARAPADREMNTALFDRLLATGKARHALELLHGASAAALDGPLRAQLRAVELQATLAVSGAPAARTVLDKYPELRSDAATRSVAARVLWESGDRPGAVEILRNIVAQEPRNLVPRMALVEWLRELGDEPGAVDLALAATRDFPDEPAPRVQLIDVGAKRLARPADWWREIAKYLTDFQAQPKAVFLLADLAGRRGWIDLSRTVVELGARRGQDLGMLGIFYADALARQNRLAEMRSTLDDIAQQCGERNVPFLQQLRQREIALAAATNDREGVRESARRLATLVRSDTDLTERYRQLYQRLGLTEAVAELSERSARPAPPIVKRGT